MNFEKIKDLIIEKKVYLIAGAVILGLFFMFTKENGQQASTLEANTSSVKMKSSSQESTSSMASSATSSTSSEPKEVTCDISGAVKKEGVYTLRNGARLDELIQAAGGLKENAQLKAINRAIVLKDQDKIHIPYKGEKVAAASTLSQVGQNSNSQSGNDANGKVNLNTASAADLQKLNGIGEKKAEQIIAYRKQKGGFKKVEDLMQVSGIGEKTFAQLKDQLAI